MLRYQIPLLFAAATMGCSKPTPPPALPPSATTSSQPKPDQTKTPLDMKAVPPGRLVECAQDAEVLERLMGAEARVYQFAGTFMEFWLEFETSDGLSERSDAVRIEESLFRANMDSDQESLDTAKHMQGWIVVRGDLHKSLDLHLREEVRIAENQTLGWATPVSHLDLPEREGSTLRGGYDSLGSIQHNPVELPEETGKEFTVFANTWKERGFKAGIEQEIREVTVRLKGRVLATDQPTN